MPFKFVYVIQKKSKNGIKNFKKMEMISQQKSQRNFKNTVIISYKLLWTLMIIALLWGAFSSLNVLWINFITGREQRNVHNPECVTEFKGDKDCVGLTPGYAWT